MSRLLAGALAVLLTLLLAMPMTNAVPKEHPLNFHKRDTERALSLDVWVAAPQDRPLAYKMQVDTGSGVSWLAGPQCVVKHRIRRSATSARCEGPVDWESPCGHTALFTTLSNSHKPIVELVYGDSTHVVGVWHIAKLSFSEQGEQTKLRFLMVHEINECGDHKTSEFNRLPFDGVLGLAKPALRHKQALRTTKAWKRTSFALTVPSWKEDMATGSPKEICFEPPRKSKWNAGSFSVGCVRKPTLSLELAGWHTQAAVGAGGEISPGQTPEYWKFPDTTVEIAAVDYELNSTCVSDNSPMRCSATEHCVGTTNTVHFDSGATHVFVPLAMKEAITPLLHKVRFSREWRLWLSFSSEDSQGAFRVRTTDIVFIKDLNQIILGYPVFRRCTIGFVLRQ